jgi:hypothetical protein
VDTPACFATVTIVGRVVKLAPDPDWVILLHNITGFWKKDTALYQN